jgi:hypothetical protein
MLKRVDVFEYQFLSLHLISIPRLANSIPVQIPNAAICKNGWLQMMNYGLGEVGLNI